MEKAINIQDRLGSMAVASALFVVGIGFMVLGVTFLPVIGVLVGIPILWVAWNFLAPKAIVSERIAGFMVPNNVAFHEGHGWARVGRNDIITVGMDDFAVKLIGEVDSISLPEKGSKVKQGSPAWRIKAENREIHMLSPVEGDIVAVNRKVIGSPELALSDPYGKGWLFKVANSKLENMIPESMVRNWLENIRQALFCQRQDVVAAGLYQDGGEPVSGLAKAIDPEKWDELAGKFLLTK
jgi:glycine cleavage system H lipoate-binding protein